MSIWLPTRFWRLILRQIKGRPMRSGLTIAGVAIGLLLFVLIEGLQYGVTIATQPDENDTTLVVYRENRYCPATSTLPEIYQSRITELEGVLRVMPIQVVVNNCRASLDVVTFRGMKEDDFKNVLQTDAVVIDGSLDEWLARNDAAFLGSSLASRRSLSVGDRFEAAGYQVTVAGILESDRSGYDNLAFVHLPYIQYANRSKQGQVTQFNVIVDGPEKMDAVAAQIDEMFHSDQAPTHTRAERAFVADIAGDIVHIIGVVRYLGWACLAAVLALICNAMALSVQDRVVDNAVLQTLGYRRTRVFQLVVGEGLVLGVCGGIVGSLGAFILLWLSRVNLSVEGISIPIEVGVTQFLIGAGIATGIGLIAGIIPAMRAARRDLVSCFRAI
ncbi:MAG: ABC transporter permease [Phycisphaerales bacterium]|nr:ABC transporter permease [Phycisphaerales bacterium]